MFFLVVIVNDECTCSFSTSSEHRCIRVYSNSSRSQIVDCLLNYFMLEFGCIILVHSLTELGIEDSLRENVPRCSGPYHFESLPWE